MAAECLHCSHCLPLSLVGIAGGELHSMTLCNGRGLAAGVAEGRCKACLSCQLLWTSLWCGLLVCLICGKQSKRPSRQYTWCLVLVLWEIVSKKNNYHLIHTHRPIAKYIKVPIAK